MRPMTFAFLFLLVGCQSAPSPSRQLDIQCNTYANTLDALAVHNELGNLSTGQEATVDQVVAVVGPLCRAQAAGTIAAPDIDETLRTVELELIRMAKIKREIENGR